VPFLQTRKIKGKVVWETWGWFSNFVTENLTMIHIGKMFCVIAVMGIFNLYLIKEDYYSFVQEGYYQIPVPLLKKGWQEAKYVALYVKNGIADVHSVSVYRKIVGVTFEQLKNKEYVKFQVDYWQNLKQVIRPVHFKVAVIACANKLLHWIYALLKSKSAFQDLA
jgi:hypothetical protein